MTLHCWVNLTFLTHFLSRFNRCWSSVTFIPSRTEAVYFSEMTLKTRKSTRCHNTEDHILNCTLRNFVSHRLPTTRKGSWLFVYLTTNTIRHKQPIVSICVRLRPSIAADYLCEFDVDRCSHCVWWWCLKVSILHFCCSLFFYFIYLNFSRNNGWCFGYTRYGLAPSL